MSTRHALESDTRSDAKSRLVRHFCVFSSTLSKFQLGEILSGRLVIWTNVRKSQNSDADEKETLLLGTEQHRLRQSTKSEAGWSHQSHDKANAMLISNVLQNISRKVRHARSVAVSACRSSSPKDLSELVYVGNSAPQQGRR